MKHLFARSFLVFVLSLVSAIPAFAEKTYRFKKLPPATLRSLAATPAPPPLPRENRHERRDRKPRPERQRSLRTDAVSTPPLLVTTATIAPPPMAAGFASDTSETLSPADSSGAVSKTHVVSASNAGIVVHTRSGARVTQLTLSQFWRNSNTIAEFYDPRLSYDASADRWITAAIRNERSLMLAVSKSGDPAGTWYRYEVAIDTCDFTRLALTRNTVLLSTTIEAGGDYSSVLFSFDKAPLYAGAENLIVRQHNNSSYSLCPVDAPDSVVEYVADVGNEELYFRRLDQTSQPFQFVSAGFTWSYADYFTEIGQQAGTNNTLDLGYGDLQAAVYRDGWLYAIHRISTNPKTNDDNALLWWRIDPDGVRPGTVGLIDSPAGVNYAYPSLAVSRNGGMLISYCVLSKTTYPSTAYVYRDPSGRVSTPEMIRTGDSPILSTDRWGDYTTVVTDPANDRDFWVAQIYASRNNWQTWWAQVKPAGRSRAARK
jgi:hypothetical protein